MSGQQQSTPLWVSCNNFRGASAVFAAGEHCSTFNGGGFAVSIDRGWPAGNHFHLSVPLFRIALPCSASFPHAWCTSSVDCLARSPDVLLARGQSWGRLQFPLLVSCGVYCTTSIQFRAGSCSPRDLPASTHVAPRPPPCCPVELIECRRAPTGPAATPAESDTGTAQRNPVTTRSIWMHEWVGRWCTDARARNNARWIVSIGRNFLGSSMRPLLIIMEALMQLG
jgi:hypothetical protein